MKKLLLALGIILLMGRVVSAQQLELKEVITRSARGIEETLPQRAKVIVLNFESPAKTFSDYVIDELSGELIEGKKITVVDRRNLTAIMDEMKFQYSGYVSDESMQSIGKMLGAQVVISGSLTDVGANYRFRIRIISVETAAVQRQISLDLKKDSQVAYLLGGAQAMREAERQQQEAKKEQQKIDRKNEPKVANARNNWLSTGLTGFGVGFGFRYERMLNTQFALGADTYFNILGLMLDEGIVGFEFGADVTARFYPWGKIFYIGSGLGFHGCRENQYFDKDGNKIDEESYYKLKSKNEAGESRDFISGFTITPELGFKIDWGNAGGFFMDIGVKVPLIISEDQGLRIGFAAYIGLLGLAF